MEPHQDEVEALARAFAAALLAGDEVAAEVAIRDAIAANLSAAEVNEEIIAPAMWLVGDLWQRGEITVADEHLATEIAMRVLVLEQEARRVQRGRRDTRVMLATPPGERHVVALREIADTAVSPEDLKEELVHSLQKYVEVDEPEPEGVPLIGAPGTGVDADDTEVITDRMSEEELLKGLEGLTPPENQPEPEADMGDEED